MVIRAIINFVLGDGTRQTEKNKKSCENISDIIKMTINSIKHFFRKLSHYDVISYEHAMMYALPAFPNLPLRIMYRAYWKYKAQK